jgi:hypothetical protein
MECSIAFEKVPRRGLEIGGILLGRTETEGNATTVWVDGFRAVESEHQLGPSYLLSESDLVRLRDELARCGGGCVGTFRSQTRAKQLAIATTDVRVFEQCFPGADALFLMLAPALNRGAVFARAEGDLKCVHELALPQSLPTGIARQGRAPHDCLPKPANSRALSLSPAIPSAETPVRIFSSKWRGWYAAALIAMLALGASVRGLADLVHLLSFAQRVGFQVYRLESSAGGFLPPCVVGPELSGVAASRSSRVAYPGRRLPERQGFGFFGASRGQHHLPA